MWHPGHREPPSASVPGFRLRVEGLGLGGSGLGGWILSPPCATHTRGWGLGFRVEGFGLRSHDLRVYHGLRGRKPIHPKPLNPQTSPP